MDNNGISSAESAVQEELQSYLSSKGVNTLFIRIVEQLLMEKPENPVGFIVDYLLTNFPDDTNGFIRKDDALNKETKEELVTREEVKEEEEDDDDDEEEEEDDDEYVSDLPETEVKKNNTNRGRRVSVSAGVLNMSQMNVEEKKVIFEKSEQEFQTLQKIISNNWLCSHLDDTEVKTVVDAMERTTVESGVEVITQGDKVADHYFVLEQGTAEVLKDGVVVLEYGPGDGFGELALMYNAPRAATVRATSDCTIWRLDQMTFKIILMGSSMKKREKYISFLEKVPILSEMGSKERMVLADSLTERDYSKDQVIVKQGDSGDEFFIISQGKVGITVNGQFMSELGEGQYFGEIALLTAKNRQATVAALTDTVKVLSVHRKVFQRVLGPLSEILKRNMVAYSQFVSGVKI